jgi:hypothetical protein
VAARASCWPAGPPRRRGAHFAESSNREARPREEDHERHLQQQHGQRQADGVGREFAALGREPQDDAGEGVPEEMGEHREAPEQGDQRPAEQALAGQPEEPEAKPSHPRIRRVRAQAVDHPAEVRQLQHPRGAFSARLYVVEDVLEPREAEPDQRAQAAIGGGRPAEAHDDPLRPGVERLIDQPVYRDGRLSMHRGGNQARDDDRKR